MNDTTIDEYIDAFPEPTRGKLEELRGILKAAAPAATERMSYDMPSLFLHGNLVYYAGYKAHVGLYGTSGFDAEMSEYKRGKGTLQFPLDGPLPAESITKVVQAKAEANARKALGPGKDDI